MKSVYRNLKNKNLDIIGGATSHGQLANGTELAPDTLRKAGLTDVCKMLGWNVLDKGNFFVESSKLDKVDLSKYKFATKVKDALAIGQYNKRIYQAVKDSANNRHFALTLGGDHSVASGSITALKESYPSLKIIWIDAHADINTPETTNSGNYHGMPVSHLVGLTPLQAVPGFDWLKPTVKFSDIVYIGLRSVDKDEAEFLHKFNIKHYDMDCVTEKGIGRVMNEIFDYFGKTSDDANYPIHISFDIDGCDIDFVKQTGTICRGGLTDRESHYILRKTVETQRLVSMDMVELNPLLGNDEDKMEREHTHGDFPFIKGTATTCFTLELLQTALGYRICI